jgi:glycosyltransferase involved in cell wall biosynthesis
MLWKLKGLSDTQCGAKAVRADAVARANIEVVVDNFSTDTTQRIVSQSRTARFWRVPGERSKARNLGAKPATGNYLLFVDSDMELQQTVVGDAVRLVGQGCEAVVIPEVSLGDTFWARVRTLERLTYLDTASHQDIHNTSHETIMMRFQ